MDKRIKYSEPLQGGHFTISMRMRTDKFRNYDQVILADQSRYDSFRLTIQRSFGILQFFAPNIGTYAAVVVDDGKEHLITLVLDNEELKFYRDEMKMYTFPVPGGMIGTENNLYIGANADSSNPYFGEIDGISVYNRSFSDREIAEIALSNIKRKPSCKATSNVPPAPLYEDPLFNSAKDGTVVFNPVENNWWFIYMQIRNGNNEPGVSVHHGTTIGAATSPDGIKWTYRGMLMGLEEKPGKNTFWAPEIIRKDGVFHGYFSFVRGINSDWVGDRVIKHYTSQDLINWTFVNSLDGIGSCRCLDCGIHSMPDGEYGLWFKDEVFNCTGFAHGKDLCHFEPGEFVDPTSTPMEGYDIFYWKNKYWMMGDEYPLYNGVRVYKSDDCKNWKRCSGILTRPGKRTLDRNIAHHPEVIINKDTDEAYIFYWVNGDPCTPYPSNGNCYLQVARLKYENGEISCDRDEEFELNLGFPKD